MYVQRDQNTRGTQMLFVRERRVYYYWFNTISQFLVKLMFVTFPLHIIVIDVSLRLEMAFSEKLSKSKRSVFNLTSCLYGNLKNNSLHFLHSCKIESLSLLRENFILITDFLKFTS